MMNDLKEILEMLSEKGYTPSEMMILHELSCYTEFIELDEKQQNEIYKAIYSDYIGGYEPIEVLVDKAIKELSL